jgi:hypothetical protein
MKYLIPALLLLASCGGNNPTPAPTPAPVPTWRGDISPQSSWAITQGSYPGPLNNGAFDFQPGDPASIYVSYIEVPLPVSLYGDSTFSLTYTFAGDPSMFLCTSCAAGTPVTVRLLLHQVGDNLSGQGVYAYYRWFSVPQPLTAGTNTVTVPLGDVTQWTPVYNGGAAANAQVIALQHAANAQGYVIALQHIGSIGVCFGGGDFACHGVAGSGHFQIDSVSVQ